MEHILSISLYLLTGNTPKKNQNAFNLEPSKHTLNFFFKVRYEGTSTYNVLNSRNTKRTLK